MWECKSWGGGETETARLWQMADTLFDIITVPEDSSISNSLSLSALFTIHEIRKYENLIYWTKARLGFSTLLASGGRAKKGVEGGK